MQNASAQSAPATNSSALDLNHFLVKEHVGMFKAANNYDIFDPNSGETILHCERTSWAFLQSSSDSLTTSA